MDVDEAGPPRQVRGHRARGGRLRLKHGSDGDDPVLLDGDVAAEPGIAGAVDDPAAAENEIVDRSLSSGLAESSRRINRIWGEDRRNATSSNPPGAACPRGFMTFVSDYGRT